jgi:hypothetical protein
MAKPDVLDRVSADLAVGHTQPAIQRLSSLVAAHPTDLDLRQRLAKLHRMVGNRIEAGRWDYLTPGADCEEVAAFERAFPLPSRRLAALRWPQLPELLVPGTPARPGRVARTSPRRRASDSVLVATGYARDRLESLIRAVTVERANQTATARRRWSPRAAGLAAAGLAVAIFVVLGAVTVTQWLLP